MRGDIIITQAADHFGNPVTPQTVLHGWRGYQSDDRHAPHVDGNTTMSARRHCGAAGVAPVGAPVAPEQE